MRTLLVVVLAAVVLAPLAARAQANDPLTPAEADQVRDTAGDLARRVPLLLKFAEARLTHFEQVRTASPRPPDRDTQLYELLREYREILPEADDAVDDLISSIPVDGKKHKPPKAFAEAVKIELRLTDELHRIQTESSPADMGTYHFILDGCLDVTSDSLQNVQKAASGQ